MGKKNSNRFEYLRFLSFSELLIALSFLTPSPKKNKINIYIKISHQWMNHQS